MSKLCWHVDDVTSKLNNLITCSFSLQTWSQLIGQSFKLSDQPVLANFHCVKFKILNRHVDVIRLLSEEQYWVHPRTSILFYHRPQDIITWGCSRLHSFFCGLREKVPNCIYLANVSFSEQMCTKKLAAENLPFLCCLFASLSLLPSVSSCRLHH